MEREGKYKDQYWIELKNYEIFNKLNNAEPIIVIQILRDFSKIEEYRLKNAIAISFDQILSEELPFQRYADQIFPFLQKQSINYHKVLRRVLLFFSDNEERIDETKEDNRRKVYDKFYSFLKGLHAKVVFGNHYEEIPSSLEVASPCNTESDEINKEFQVIVYSSESIFEEFHDRYRQCHSLYHWSQELIHGRCFDDYFATEILPDFLFLGDYVNATTKEQLEALRITHIIDATNQYLSQPLAEFLGLQYLPINIWDRDEVDISEYFPVAFEFIAKAKQDSGLSSLPRVLIHCRAGVSRSASLVIAYLVQAERMTLKEAIQHVVTQRPVVCPNDGFQQQLYRFEQSVLDSSSFTTWQEIVTVIHQSSRLYSTPITQETAFDRIPINAIKKSTQFHQQWSEYPESSGPGGEPGEATEVTQEETKEVVKDVKPKKPFLKRGEGKTIHQEVAKQKRLELQQKKKEWRDKQKQPLQQSSSLSKLSGKEDDLASDTVMNEEEIPVVVNENNNNSHNFGHK